MKKTTTTPAASLAAHTPGEIKWDGTGRLHSTKHGRYLAHDNRSAGYGGYTGEEEGANQARLAACWNACEKYFPQSDPAAGIAAMRGAVAGFVQLSNNLAVSLTPEQISESTVALTNHCHAARLSLAGKGGAR